MNKFKYEILSGIDYKYIEEYFNNICDRKDSGNKFYGNGWTVKIEHQKPITYSVIVIPSTKIIFTGNKEKCQKLIHSFRMKFLSAGG